MQLAFPAWARRSSTIAAVVLLAVLAASCGGGSSRYSKYQDKDASVRKIDALLATVPQYPGARRQMRQIFSGSYHVAPDDFISAEPYTGDFYYATPTVVAAPTIRRYFRRVMASHGWSCRFPKHSSGPRLRFGCTRGRGELAGFVADQGYGLQVGIGQKRPPIKTIPGD
jgi:hypothetical protein